MWEDQPSSRIVCKNQELLENAGGYDNVLALARRCHLTSLPICDSGEEEEEVLKEGQRDIDPRQLRMT